MELAEGEVGGDRIVTMGPRKNYFLSDCGLHIPQDSFQKGGNQPNLRSNKSLLSLGEAAERRKLIK